jgi:hypothetical protein
VSTDALPLIPLVAIQARFKCLLDRVKMPYSVGEQVIKPTQKS